MVLFGKIYFWRGACDKLRQVYQLRLIIKPGIIGALGKCLVRIVLFVGNEVVISDHIREVLWSYAHIFLKGLFQISGRNSGNLFQSRNFQVPSEIDHSLNYRINKLKGVLIRL